eukprot:s1888_g10.t2
MAEWTLVYHDGPLKGRAEPLKLLLEDAGMSYEVSSDNLYGEKGHMDAFRGSSAAVAALDNAPAPVMFPPVIWHRPPVGEEVYVNQTAACMTYLGMLRRLPEDWDAQRIVEWLRENRLKLTQIDFLYVPFDKRADCNIELAFINFVDHSAAKKVYNIIVRQNRDGVLDTVVSAGNIQGFDWNLAYFLARFGHQGLWEKDAPLIFRDGYQLQDSQEIMGVYASLPHEIIAEATRFVREESAGTSPAPGSRRRAQQLPWKLGEEPEGRREAEIPAPPLAMGTNVVEMGLDGSEEELLALLQEVQTGAWLRTLGYAPGTPAETARADQITQNAVDYIAEGRSSFHPVDQKASYSTQKDEADTKSKAWCDGRMTVWLQHFEKVVKRAGAEKPIAGGSNITYADFMLFHALDATEAQFNTDFYGHAWDAVSIPHLKAYKSWFASRPRLQAYFTSERRKPWAGDSMM